MSATGPHLIAALICERVINESDGVLSLIRVVDRLTTTAAGAAPPEVMPPVNFTMQMVVILKPDQAKGRFTVKLVLEAPSGERTPVGEQDITLAPGSRGNNLIIGMEMTFGHEGVYWFDVMLGGPRGQEDERLTRTPLEVVYQRQVVPQPQSPQ